MFDLDPIQRRQYGIYAILLSMIFAAAAIAAGTGTAIKRQSVASESAAVIQECQNRMGVLGATKVTVNEDSVTASWPSLEGGMTTLSAASSAAMACPGWVMDSFCMGQGCSEPGAKIVLKRAVAQ